VQGEQSSVPISRGSETVSLAMKYEPLSVSHSMGSDSLLIRPNLLSSAVMMSERPAKGFSLGREVQSMGFA